MLARFKTHIKPEFVIMNYESTIQHLWGLFHGEEWFVAISEVEIDAQPAIRFFVKPTIDPINFTKIKLASDPYIVDIVTITGFSPFN